MIKSPSESGDPISPYYLNLFGIGANDQYFRAYNSKVLIQKMSKEQLILKTH